MDIHFIFKFIIINITSMVAMQKFEQYYYYLV